MADGYIGVTQATSPDVKMQSYRNTVGANSVDAEAVTLVQVDGTPYTPSTFKNLSANATLNVKSSTGRVFSLSCYNGNAASRYIQIHNTATVPATNAVPIFSFFVPSLAQIVIGTDFFTNEGIAFATGIAFAFSTTLNTYTAGSAGDQSTFIQYK